MNEKKKIERKKNGNLKWNKNSHKTEYMSEYEWKEE